MRSISQSAERQQNVELDTCGGIARIYLRKDHRLIEDEEGQHWECAEAFMECTSDDAPTETEITEDFEDWYEYAADWQPGRQKSLDQLQADIEYIAAMTGVELEG